MNRRPIRFGSNALRERAATHVCALALCLGSVGTAMAAPADPGRLFFTPAQRAQLEATRTRNAAPPGPGQQASSDSAPPPLRYDGVVIRSDGKTTRWVDGKPQPGPSAVPGLKPGQIRVDGKVYEPYQVLRPVAPDASPGEPAEESPPR